MEWQPGEFDSIFFQKHNTNQKNINLTYEYYEKAIAFLDLDIILGENSIITKTIFKPVERNSYIPVDSCHYDPWLSNIPKGQLICLRRNCRSQSDFIEQAQLIGKKFIHRGYNEDFTMEKI